MAGIDYGNKFCMKANLNSLPEGVHYSKLSDKFIVRFTVNGTMKSIAQYNNIKDANKHYKKLLITSI